MMFHLDDERKEPQPVEVRVPGLSTVTGLGDAVKRLTEAFGVQPCPPCQKRQQLLNERVKFVPWQD